MTDRARHTTWTALIVDDEPAARRGVRQLLAAFPEFSVAGECRDGGEALATLDTLNPDVVFLDIQMPGIDGFEVIKRRTPERMPLVVFLTAYDQFAIHAFEAQALDYLVKPVTEARFAATMRRLSQQLRATSRNTYGVREETLTVTTSRGTLIIPLHEIDWIESADNYARIWAGGKSYLLRESIRALEQRAKRCGFARAHRQALVRAGAVRALVAAESGETIAVLASGARIPVSRRRRTAFMEAVRFSGNSALSEG